MAGQRSISREGAVREVVRQRVFEQVATRWRRIHTTRLPGLLFSPLFGTRRLKGIFLVEHDCAGASSLTCTGNVIAAWHYDHDGWAPLEPDEVVPGPTRGHLYFGEIWERPIWRFWISEDNASVILNEEAGPGDAWLSEDAVVLRRGQIRLKCRRALSHDQRPLTAWNVAATLCEYALAILPLIALLTLLGWLLGS